MLFYHPDLSVSDIVLDPDESGHLIRVLRKKPGDAFRVTDGKGCIADAVIKDGNPRKCRAEITNKNVYTPDPFYIHIAVAPTKNLERIGWFVEKAVELGIHEISFPICKHSERDVLKTDKLIAKAISAMKQSLSPFLPKINETVKFSAFVKSADQSFQNFIAHLENESTPDLNAVAKKGKSYCVLIGPEGDFDANEIDAAVRSGFEMVKMGTKRLRTETAALHACSLLNGLNY